MLIQPQPGATQPDPAPNPATARSGMHGRSVLAILCAFMVLFAATLRVAHSHSPAEQESGHCQICLAIHAAAPAAAAPLQIVLHAAPEPILTPAPSAAAKVPVETLSDRAPPQLA